MATAQASGIDNIALDEAIFTRLTWVNGALADGQFASVTDATPAAEGTRLVYNATTGELIYDHDGNGTGDAGVVIAILGTTTHPAALAAADFMQV